MDEAAALETGSGKDGSTIVRIAEFIGLFAGRS
jgi:hypothetical protein